MAAAQRAPPAEVPDEKTKHFLNVSKAPSHPRPHKDRRTWPGMRVDLAKEMNLLKGDLVQVLVGGTRDPPEGCDGRSGLFRLSLSTAYM